MRKFLTRLRFWRRNKNRYRLLDIPFDTPDAHNEHVSGTIEFSPTETPPKPYYVFGVPADLISNPDPSSLQSVEQAETPLQKLQRWIKRKRESARWN